MSAKLINKILSEVSLDPRVHDGVFKLEEEAHMSVLREYLVNHGIEEAAAIEFCNKVLEGKYPERQAYNKNGILVTFPTPEYKKKAIQAGTHFEKDPTKGMSNLFKSPSPSQSKEEPPAPKEPQKGGEPKTQLPVSQAQPDPTAPKTQEPQPQTTAAPMSTPEPAQPVADPVEPTELPPPAPKSPQEKEADKQAIKTMLKGDDYMLERVVEFVLYNGHPSLIEDLRRKL